METTEHIAQREPLAVPVWASRGTSAASSLNLSRSSVYRAVASGELPTIKVGGRYLVPVDAIRRMLAKADDHDPAA